VLLLGHIIKLFGHCGLCLSRPNWIYLPSGLRIKSRTVEMLVNWGTIPIDVRSRAEDLYNAGHGQWFAAAENRVEKRSENFQP